MRVLQPRAALLSDFEVLALLRDLETTQRRQARQPAPAVFGTPAAAVLEAAAAAAAGGAASTAQDGDGADTDADAEAGMALLPPNLRTVQYELLAYLSNAARPAAHQSAAQIAAFKAALARWEREEHLGDARLTRGERLMCVNLAPTTLVELHCIVEELADRMTEAQSQALLELIATHLPRDSDVPSANGINGMAHGQGSSAGAAAVDEDAEWEERERREEEMREMREQQANEDFVVEGRGEGAVDDELPEEE